MVYSLLFDHFDQAWAQLQKQFKIPQRYIVNYITNNLIPIYQEWAGCWTKLYLNFGQRTTSPNEASNGSVKSYGLSAYIGFNSLFLTIDSWVDDRYIRFQEGVALSATRVRIAYLDQAWLGDCPYKISYTALDLLNQ